jgi:hypothetical protein
MAGCFQQEPSRDFDIAVQTCDNETVARHVRAWIDDLTAGVDSPRSLRDRIDEDSASL